MRNRILRWFAGLVISPCPHCLSHESRHGTPKESCVICNNYKGTAVHWVYRWNWLHRILVTNRNFKRALGEQDD